MPTATAIWLGVIFSIALMVSGIVIGAIALYEKRTVFVIGALHRDESGAVHGRLRSAINILFRLAIIAFVGLLLWTTSDIIWFWLHRLVRIAEGREVFTLGWRKIVPLDLFTLFGGVLLPGSALAAIVLAAANKYLALAVLSAIASYFLISFSCC
ncbi:MAG TPA: hypothetical protein VGF53_16845 [Pseudolabrys sp.]|jgi:hypothetical protein